LKNYKSNNIVVNNVNPIDKNDLKEKFDKREDIDVVNWSKYIHSLTAKDKERDEMA